MAAGVYAPAADAQTPRVLVTNDDGVGAPGIDALVNQLQLNANLVLDIVAPATNQSGTTDGITATPFTATSSITASGDAGIAVAAKPADSVLYAVLQGLSQPPDLVVSGINLGQNITSFVAEDLSGTVGAVVVAGKFGIPGIAVSADVVTPNYATAAIYTANVIELYRTSSGFAKKMISKNGLDQRLLLNINVPTCSSGAIRGVEVVPLKASQDVLGRVVTGYNSTGVDTWQAVFSSDNAFLAQDCTSTLENPTQDLEAFQNGFIAVSPLNPTITPDGKVKKFKALEKVAFQ